MEALHPTDPATIGDYRLLGRLGGGGTSVVYLGAGRAGRRVAVTVIRADVAADPAFRSRFAREVAAARRLGRRWTASVVAADAEAETPWLATEYLPDPSLQEVVSRDGPLPAPAAIMVARRLAEAIGAIHAAGLVHRDVNPTNVFMTPDGPVLIGLGRGFARPPAIDSADPTAVVDAAGYRSPELIRGERVRPPSDVYSLGATLAYAVTGRAPFGARGPDGVPDRELTAGPELAAAPPPLPDLILACLAKRPARRPTPAEITQALPAAATRATSGGPRSPTGRPATTPAGPSGGGRVRRSREGDILAGLIVLPLIGIAAVPAMLFPFGLLVVLFMLGVPRAVAEHAAESVPRRPPGHVGPATLLFAPFRTLARGLVAGFALLAMTLVAVLFGALLVVLSTGVFGPIASWALGDALSLPRGSFNAFFIKLAASVLIIGLPEALGPSFRSWLGAGIGKMQATATELQLIAIWLVGVLVFAAALLWLPTPGWWPLPYGR